MKILVPIKLCYDVGQMKFDSNTGEPILDAVPRSMGEADRCALEEALKIKDSIGGEVVVVTIGEARTHSKMLRDAFAMGATGGYLVSTGDYDKIDLNTVTMIFKALVEATGPYDLIIMGAGSTDTHSSLLPPMLGAKLGIKTVVGIDKLEYADGEITAVCTYGDGSYTYKLKPPALLSVTSEANLPRIPTIKDILRAKKMKFEELSVESLVENIGKVDVLGIEKYIVPRKKLIWEVDSEDKLAEALENILSVLREGV